METPPLRVALRWVSTADSRGLHICDGGQTTVRLGKVNLPVGSGDNQERFSRWRHLKHGPILLWMKYGIILLLIGNSRQGSVRFRGWGFPTNEEGLGSGL